MIQFLLTNTLTNQREKFISLQDNKVLLYVCGITPYDIPHVGHGRVYVTFDVLVRLLTFLGYEVIYCRNITDIDDKILKRTIEQYKDPRKFNELVNHCLEAFHEDMRALNCLTPTYEPRVTDNMSHIITFIQELIAVGKAYVVDGDVYYSIRSFSDYGKLSKRNLEDLRSGARVAINEKKADPLDFVLWKKEEEGVFWESPWGRGRPGWHIECSTLASKYLGKTIDIHGGGMDLIFPHHENEIAQSEGLFGFPFARYWMHNAFVQVNKEKMSKSLGNFFHLREVFTTFSPLLIRYVFLQHQYRNPLDFSLDDIANTKKSYQRLAHLMHKEGTPKLAQLMVSDLHSRTQEMLSFLCQDLNTPGFFGCIFQNFSEIEKDALLRGQVKYLLNNILGLSMEPLPETSVTITPEMEAIIEERDQARLRKDWKKADELRNKLRDMGLEVQDKKDT